MCVRVPSQDLDTLTETYEVLVAEGRAFGDAFAAFAERFVGEGCGADVTAATAAFLACTLPISSGESK